MIIPAYNEENSIGDTVRSAWEIPGVSQVLVVDDGSGDGTAGAALGAGGEVISLGRNRGKGGAINAGAVLVREKLVILLDADLGGCAFRAGDLLPPVAGGLADMTVAVFPDTGGKAGFGLVMGLARAGIKHFTGLEVSAPLSGQRAMTRRVLTECLPLAGGFGAEVDFTVRAGMKGFRIMEVPVNLSHRATGRNIQGFIHRGRQFLDVARALWAAKRPGCGNA